MKIVQVCGWYFPDSLGGTENYVSALAADFARAGHDVVVAAPDPSSAGEHNYVHEGVPVYRYPIPPAPTRGEARHQVAARGADHFHAWLARTRPDIVHFHTFVTGVGPHEITAARRAGARVFVTSHAGSLGFLCERGTMMSWGTALCDGVVTPSKCAACALQARHVPRPLAALLGGVPAPLGRVLATLPGPLGSALGMTYFVDENLRQQAAVLAEVDRFFVLTDWAQHALEINGFDRPRVTVNRLGIRAPEPFTSVRRRQRAPGEPLTIAYLGRFERIKGVHDLARAINALGGEISAQFEFRGPVTDARERAVVGELKAIVGPHARVRFGDPLPPSGVLEYLRGVDVLCAPSLALEGGPTAALEAMAVGTPVVATSAGAMAEVIRDGVSGRLVAPGDWRALARALREIIEDPRTTIDRWRTAMPRVRTMHDVAIDYLRAYDAPMPVAAAAQ